MIGDTLVRFGGLAWLIEQRKPIIAILVCKIDFYTFAGKVLERIIIMLSVD